MKRYSIYIDNSNEFHLMDNSIDRISNNCWSTLEELYNAIPVEMFNGSANTYLNTHSKNYGFIPYMHLDSLDDLPKNYPEFFI